MRKSSLFWQITLAFTTVCAVLLCLLIATLYFIGQTSGKGSAINLSGSLRMQSYVLALTVARTQESSFEIRKKDISDALDEFERRLLSEELTSGIPTDPSNHLRIEYNSVYRDFYDEIRPLALRLIETPSLNVDFFRQIPLFVDRVDNFVLHLEKTLDGQIDDLKNVIFATLIVLILVSVVFLIYLRKTLFQPLGKLSDLASKTRKGDFTARSNYDKDNEIGKLSEAMNFMVEDLSRMYSSLEDQVKEKTADLNLQNKSLNLLYKLKDLLDTDPLSEDILKQSLDLVDKSLGTCGCYLYLYEESTQSLRSIASVENDQINFKLDSHSLLDSVDVNKYSLVKKNVNQTELSIQTIPLSGDRLRGLLLLAYCTKNPFIQKQSLLHNIGQNFIEAIERSENTEESRRLAILEERSTIARELHDSIAQSLAYSKIQLTRLSRAIQQLSPISEQLDIVGDLRIGVNEAYRHLREVLVAFRLKPQSSNLKHNLLQLVKEFSERSSLEIKLDDTLQNFELNGNQQIHLLQIVREALTNVEKHARATSVKIFLGGTSNGKIRLSISDNGVGFDAKNIGKRGHFGLSIMDERAKALGGTLGISKNILGGTLVTVEFLS